MRTSIDLHIHTDSSDGTWSLDELMRALIASSVRVFSITDHDTLDNAVKLLATPDRFRHYGMQYVLGVEISCRHESQEYHVTAYSFNPRDDALRKILEQHQQARIAHNDRLIRFLAQMHPELDDSKYASYRHDKARGGWKALNFLLDEGFIQDTSEYFRLTKGLGFFPAFADAQRVINTIHQSGGLCFLAHPNAYFDGKRMPQRQLGEWLEMGISGFECYSPYCGVADAEAYVAFCRSNGLLISAGSDCHGAFGGRILGVPNVTHEMIIPSVFSNIPRTLPASHAR